ncbi:MAG: hypothetical protein ACT6RD_12075 [Brevundimonas sp.]|uniref:hypothetical protein n=1 Tax=Brevundimonas sp. TaxID=1871086 RepID=UPI004034CC4E
MTGIHQGLAIIGCVLAVAASAGTAQAQRSPNGTWRCSAQGNIPIGIMTVSGATYRFQAVRNTAWAPKAQDSMNGSGALRGSGTTLTPAGGPLTTRLGARSGYFGETGIPGDRYDYIDFFNDPQAAYVLRCHRP